MFILFCAVIISLNLTSIKKLERFIKVVSLFYSIIFGSVVNNTCELIAYNIFLTISVAYYDFFIPNIIIYDFLTYLRLCLQFFVWNIFY